RNRLRRLHGDLRAHGKYGVLASSAERDSGAGHRAEASAKEDLILIGATQNRAEDRARRRPDGRALHRLTRARAALLLQVRRRDVRGERIRSAVERQTVEVEYERRRLRRVVRRRDSSYVPPDAGAGRDRRAAVLRDDWIDHRRREAIADVRALRTELLIEREVHRRAGRKRPRIR